MSGRGCRILLPSKALRRCPRLAERRRKRIVWRSTLSLPGGLRRPGRKAGSAGREPCAAGRPPAGRSDRPACRSSNVRRCRPGCGGPRPGRSRPAAPVMRGGRWARIDSTKSAISRASASTAANCCCCRGRSAPFPTASCNTRSRRRQGRARNLPRTSAALGRTRVAVRAAKSTAANARGDQACIRRAGRAYARGGKRGHAARGEVQPGVGHVFLAAQDGHAQGLDLAHRGADPGQGQVDVVNHQVQDHAHVHGAEGESAGPHGFDVLGVGAAAATAAAKAGLKRSTWPTCRIRPRRRASSTSSSASPRRRQIGFSTNRCAGGEERQPQPVMLRRWGARSRPHRPGPTANGGPSGPSSRTRPLAGAGRQRIDDRHEPHIRPVRPVSCAKSAQ